MTATLSELDMTDETYDDAHFRDEIDLFHGREPRFDGGGTECEGSESSDTDVAGTAPSLGVVPLARTR